MDALTKAFSWLAVAVFGVLVLAAGESGLAEEVIFPDAGLEGAIRDALGQPEGPITDADLAGLTSLAGSDRGISDLSGLEYCTGLKRLWLEGNQITDLAPLAALIALELLFLSDNQITDPSPLNGLDGLERLFLAGNQIGFLTALDGLANLQYLSLDENQISHLGGLEYCTGLKHLSLERNQVTDLTPLAGLIGLEALSLSGNQISDLSGLSGLAALRSLSLSSNQIGDLRGIEGLSSLQSLHLDENQISDLSALSALTTLTRLELSSNQISDLSPLGGLTNLSYLYLESNQVSDLTGLGGLGDLNELHVSGNQISDLWPLSGLTGLWYLDLGSNQISDLTGLAGVTGVQTLYLSANQISDLSALKGLIGLDYLDLRNNQITEITPLVENAGLGAGDDIHLTGNPLGEEAFEIHIPALQARSVEVSFGHVIEELLVDGAHVNPGDDVTIRASARPGAGFRVYIEKHDGSAGAMMRLVADAPTDSTYASTWMPSSPGMYEVVTKRCVPAELGTASLMVFDPAEVDVAGHRAVLTRNPADRRDIQGFCPLILARPRSLSVLGGRGGGSSIWEDLKIGLGEVADAVRTWTGMDARVSGHVRFDNSALSNVPVVFAPIPNAGVVATAGEADNVSRYLSEGGFLFLENAWGIPGDEFGFGAACRQVAQDVMASAGLQEERDWGFERLPQTHPVYHCLYDIDSVPVGKDSSLCAGQGLRMCDYLEAAIIGGRLWVLFSQKGYLLGIHDFRPGGYYDGMAAITPMLELCANTIVFALTQEGGITRVEEEQSPTVPSLYGLAQNRPNPFNARTVIAYQLPRGESVSLRVYNMAGQHVGTLAVGSQKPGRYRVVWDAEGLSSGLYFCRLEAGSFVETRRMVLLK